MQIRPLTFELQEQVLDDHLLSDLILQLCGSERLAILDLTNPNRSACDLVIKG